MPKTFTQIPIHTYQAVKPETLNENIDKYLSSFNGTLDGHNMPIDTTREQHFIAPNDGGFSDATANVLKSGTTYPTQAYYKTRRSSSFEEPLDVWTPVATINLDTGTWNKGFNILTEIPDWETFPLTFEAKEGMLTGTATIDWEHGTQVFQVPIDVDGDTIFVNRSRGFEWWTEWGVFVNNILVARSGQIYPRRHTTALPFSVPCGAQQITIDVRFITLTSRPAGSPNFTVDSSEFHIFSAEIFCRNTYR
jgi:hypothetical protein